MILAPMQVPVHATPRVSVFNIHIKDHHIATNVRVDTDTYFATAETNHSRITLTGLFNSSGIEQAQPINCAVEMVPISSGQPLRIPQCGGAAFWEWWLTYCPTLGFDNIYDAPSAGRYNCSNNSYIAWGDSVNATPYSSSTEPAFHLYLSKQDAINGQTALAAAAILLTIVSAIIVNPWTIMAAALSALFALDFATLYGNDKNSDGSIDIWTPTDWTNIEYALVGGNCCPSGFYAATPHIWWKVSFVAIDVGTR